MSGYFSATTPPLTPPIASAGPVGSGQGIGLAAIGPVPIPSLFADTSAQLPGPLDGIGQGQVGVDGIDQKSQNPFRAALHSLRTDRLMRVAGRLGKAPISDAYLKESLLAAERRAERELRVFLVPREIIPDGTPFAEVQALAAQGKPMVEEPGYPYDTALFEGMDLETRHRPIINVYRLWYAYQGEGTPSTEAVQPLYDIPLDWIQMDRKYGRINLLPTASFTSLPLNTFILSVLGSGRQIPFGLKLRYSAGLIDARNDYPDLLMLIKRMAIISILDDSFLPQSGSISADGLSQSMSIDVDKYRDSVETGLGKIASSLKGIRMTILG